MVTVFTAKYTFELGRGGNHHWKEKGQGDVKKVASFASLKKYNLPKRAQMKSSKEHYVSAIFFN